MLNTVIFSKIDCHNSFTCFELSPKLFEGGSRFLVLSNVVKPFLGCNGHTKAEVYTNSLGLTGKNEKEIGTLRLGNKSLSQLKLGLLGFSIPDTIILDFSFFLVHTFQVCTLKATLPENSILGLHQQTKSLNHFRL